MLIASLRALCDAQIQHLSHVRPALKVELAVYLMLETSQIGDAGDVEALRCVVWRTNVHAVAVVICGVRLCCVAGHYSSQWRPQYRTSYAQGDLDCAPAHLASDSEGSNARLSLLRISACSADFLVSFLRTWRSKILSREKWRAAASEGLHVSLLCTISHQWCGLFYCDKELARVGVSLRGQCPPESPSQVWLERSYISGVRGDSEITPTKMYGRNKLALRG